MKITRIIRISIAACLCLMAFSNTVISGERVRVTGSGASFPFPLYSTWFKTYSRSHDNVIVDYQAKGSGAGIRDFISETVDFAASDAAMNDEEMAQVKKGALLLPMTAGEIVFAYNVPGAPKGLKLSREVYVNIFLGKIKKWNDPVITKDNPGVSLPDLDITVIRRADSSGTTYVFTKHLSAISEDWKNGPGTGKTVNWPGSDKIIAAPKNDGVTATIRQTPGSIGYIEYGYAKLARLEMAAIQNKSGKFIVPSEESGQAALAGANMPADLRIWLPDPESADAYPIVTYTWMMFYKKYDDPKKAELLRNVVQWCLTEGQKMSSRLGYIPLPANVVDIVSKAAANIK